MTKKLRRSVPASLNGAEIMITNASMDEEIMKLIGPVGYDSAGMAFGKSLLADATAKKDVHIALAGAQQGTTAAANAAKKAATDAYQSYSVLAKGEFKNKKEWLSVLGLDKPMPRTEAALISSGESLFENAATDTGIKAAMLKYGYDDAKLAEGKAKIVAFETANSAQKAAEGAAQDATEERDAALVKLNDWVAQFRKAAKVALKDKKQLLEKLGIRARSTRTKAQRGAAKKAAATRAAKKNTQK